ncbi:hypothetical protein TYRP_015347 [Tyrophagus putrescentiae]|nr:hypothetical protein TYRP_015347 [Tyrophagus putrescentiae]
MFVEARSGPKSLISFSAGLVIKYVSNSPFPFTIAPNVVLRLVGADDAGNHMAVDIVQGAGQLHQRHHIVLLSVQSKAFIISLKALPTWLKPSGGHISAADRLDFLHAAKLWLQQQLIKIADDLIEQPETLEALLVDVILVRPRVIANVQQKVLRHVLRQNILEKNFVNSAISFYVLLLHFEFRPPQLVPPGDQLLVTISNQEKEGKEGGKQQ